MGSLMFSYWLAKSRGKDLKNVRDGNPGASNLWRVMGWQYGAAGLFLDYLKGFMPLYFILQSGYFTGVEMAFLSAAPVLGHAFSPFMKFSGGKSIAVTFGVWSAMTTWVVPTIMGGFFALFSIYRYLRKKGPAAPEEDALRVLWGMLAVLFYIFWVADWVLLLLWILIAGILSYTHRKEVAALEKSIPYEK